MRVFTWAARDGRCWIRTAAVLATVAAIGCGESPDEVAAREDAIIGGTTISVATRRQLGLIDSALCSGALMDPDWVLTAAHCVDFVGPSNMVFRAPRTDSDVPDTRRGYYAIQVGHTDLAMVRLLSPPSGHMWPQVSRAITSASESSLVGQNITCSGRGDSSYEADGVGTTGWGTWKSLTKQIESLVHGSDAFGGDAYRLVAVGSPGSEILSWGDSGGNCVTSTGQTAAVHSKGGCSAWQARANRETWVAMATT